MTSSRASSGGCTSDPTPRPPAPPSPPGVGIVVTSRRRRWRRRRVACLRYAAASGELRRDRLLQTAFFACTGRRPGPRRAPQVVRAQSLGRVRIISRARRLGSNRRAGLSASASARDFLAARLGAAARVRLPAPRAWRAPPWRSSRARRPPPEPTDALVRRGPDPPGHRDRERRSPSWPWSDGVHAEGRRARLGLARRRHTPSAAARPICPSRPRRRASRRARPRRRRRRPRAFSRCTHAARRRFGDARASRRAGRMGFAAAAAARSAPTAEPEPLEARAAARAPKPLDCRLRAAYEQMSRPLASREPDAAPCLVRRLRRKKRFFCARHACPGQRLRSVMRRLASAAAARRVASIGGERGRRAPASASAREAPAVHRPSRSRRAAPAGVADVRVSGPATHASAPVAAMRRGANSAPRGDCSARARVWRHAARRHRVARHFGETLDRGRLLWFDGRGASPARTSRCHVHGSPASCAPCWARSAALRAPSASVGAVRHAEAGEFTRRARGKRPDAGGAWRICWTPRRAARRAPCAAAGGHSRTSERCAAHAATLARAAVRGHAGLRGGRRGEA